MNKFDNKYFKTAVKMDEALVKLLEKKDFDYITIKELCAEAGVNRSTFYLHYENMIDLLEEATEYLSEKFNTYFEDNEKTTMDKVMHGQPEDLIFITESHLTPYLTFIKEHRTLFAATLKHPERFRSEKSFKILADKLLYPVLERFNIPKEEQTYILLFYIDGIMGILQNWISNGCTDSEEFITQLIIKVIGI